MPRARSRSFCVRPSAEWVVSVSRTRFHPCTRMWFAASASPATAFTKAMAAAKSASCRSRTIASPSRRQSESDSPRSISSSVSLCAMRIVSLVPSATEMLFALGLGRDVTAVTHECDHPEPARELPKVTRDVIGPGLPPGEIDRAVRELTEQGQAIYELDENALRRAQPDLIVTQALCAVCAVSYDDVKAVAERLDPVPEIISLDPHTLGEVLGDVRTLAQATDTKDAGVELIEDAASRIDRVRLAVRAAQPVSVAALEWLDPIYVAGHWTPQMIEYAGGFDVLGMPGEHSERRTWDEVKAAHPEVVVVMPCGYDAERAAEEAYDFGDELEELGARRVVAVDAAAYFSRPGPRLIDGLELLAHVLHPDRLPEPPPGLVEIAL